MLKCAQHSLLYWRVNTYKVTRHTPTRTTPQGTGADTFNNSVFNDSTFNIILIYTQFILHMATYHMTNEVIYLIWQNCILIIHSDCCPDDGLIGRNM
jgi:hypothetical protein